MTLHAHGQLEEGQARPGSLKPAGVPLAVRWFPNRATGFQMRGLRIGEPGFRIGVAGFRIGVSESGSPVSESGFPNRRVGFRLGILPLLRGLHSGMFRVTILSTCLTVTIRFIFTYHLPFTAGICLPLKAVSVFNYRLL